eukprot:c13231_g1_i1.p1 GENE.c13231_g1_i1~~c13231_g1_i1.p1  ORF type:complete len:302 (+),score=54.14 c13231_g1_i1:21-926(+)
MGKWLLRVAVVVCAFLICVDASNEPPTHIEQDFLEFNDPPSTFAAAIAETKQAMLEKINSNCVRYTSCSSCIPTFGCGWCSLSGTCVIGSWSGSSQCLPEHYSYYKCPSCDSHTDCTTCVFGGLGCGWCEANSTCTSSVSSCPSTSSYYVSTCSTSIESECARYTSCTNCAERSVCGWCASSDMCVPGTTTGAANPLSCPASSWLWTSDSCPVYKLKKSAEQRTVAVAVIVPVGVCAAVVMALLLRRKRIKDKKDMERRRSDRMTIGEIGAIEMHPQRIAPATNDTAVSHTTSHTALVEDL